MVTLRTCSFGYLMDISQVLEKLLQSSVCFCFSKEITFG